ncbi:MAG TPA: methyltransferase domain-containing protein [Dehalococcoidia bacterium]|nr:methyltransferase domain-containing protein [Dehalococcoidia bacterium]
MTTVEVSQQIDQAKAEAFGGQMVEIMNGGLLALMTSIGHRTSLFDTMSAMPPATSPEIANAAGLNERYVREWLGAMVTGRIVEYDPATKAYRLPPEHAASLTRAAGPNNLAAMLQFMSLMGNVEDQIVDCFKNGGGVPYASFPKFQALMAEDSAQVFDATLVNVTLPMVPGLVNRLQEGIDVADVGCGQGHAINLMARAFPKSNFVGYDFSEGGIAAARAEAQAMGLANAEFELKDVSTLDGSRKFDLITVFDAIHDQAHPARVLKGIADSLTSDGTFLCVDVAASSNLEDNLEHPLGPMLYSVSTLHCMTVSLALGGTGLGTVWGDQLARQMFAEAGFRDIRAERVEGDIMNVYYICKK